MRQNAEDKFNTLKDLLNDQAEKLMEKWEKIKEQAEEVKRSLFNQFQKKMEEGKNWFQQFLNWGGAREFSGYAKKTATNRPLTPLPPYY